mmetsp:Transcript_6897/g.14392  ORF Transcript_6897/g.14392 Transcript_6897/m.14392 type:complete len:223 (-) Transcript_6897:481-1149(-)
MRQERLEELHAGLHHTGRSGGGSLLHRKGCHGICVCLLSVGPRRSGSQLAHVDTRDILHLAHCHLHGCSSSLLEVCHSLHCSSWLHRRQRWLVGQWTSLGSSSCLLRRLTGSTRFHRSSHRLCSSTSCCSRIALGFVDSLGCHCVGLSLFRFLLVVFHLLGLRGSRLRGFFRLGRSRGWYSSCCRSACCTFLVAFDGSDLHLSLHHQTGEVVVLLLQSAVGA